MQRISTAQVLAYVAEAAEATVKSDTNEAGRWTPMEFKELRERAFALIARTKEMEKL